jgi:hypothetical protein
MKFRASTAMTVLAALAVAAGLGAGSAAGDELGEARSLPPCGPRAAETLVAGADARVFVVKEPRASDKVMGCVEGARPQRRNVPRDPERDPGFPTEPWIDAELIALNAPWVAYREKFVYVDIGTLAMGILNLRSGARRHCPIGRWNVATGFQITGMVVTDKGSAGWIGEQQDFYFDGGELQEERRHEVHACEGARHRVLDEGGGIALDSLRLHGQVLSWTDAGNPRSAQLR